jgi:ABC-type transport system substrate-binding protein
MATRTQVQAVALALLAAGCSKSEPPQSHEIAESPRRGGTFRMAQDSPGSLDPASVDDVYEATIVNQVFDGLLAFDHHLNTVPCIATSWIISPDGNVYTFHLRQDLRFHDGSPLTADDVVFSLQRVFDLPIEESSLAREYLRHIAGTSEYTSGRSRSIRGLVALDSHTVRIELDHPYASFLAVLASELARIVPKAYVERAGDAGLAQHPIGSGPFRLAAWEPNERVVLTAFADYKPATVWLDSVVFELPPQNARDHAVQGFRSGRLSACVVPDGRLAEFERLPRTAVLTRQELSTTFVGLNPTRPPFGDLRVRQAFALAIDRAAILASGRSARIRPNGILPPGMPGYTPESKLLEHDPARARALLAAAGYPGGQGLPPIVYTTASQTEEADRLNRSIAQQLAAVGFQLTLQKMEWLDFSRHLDQKDLQCFNVTWVADIPDPDSFLNPLCQSDGGANFACYASKEVDALLSTGRNTRSATARVEIYRDAERRVLQDAALVPLFHPLSAVAIQENVRGLHITAMGFGNMSLENVWLATPPPAAVAAARRTAPRARPLEGRVP